MRDADPAAKPRLVLVAGSPELPLHNNAMALQAGLSEHFDTHVVHESNYADRKSLIIDVLCAQEATLAHFFWRESALTAVAEPWKILPGLQAQNISIDHYADCAARTVITASVTDHLMFEPRAIARRQDAFACLDGYLTGSWRLQEIYAKTFKAQPLMAVPNGVATERFVPRNLQRFEELPGRPLVLGWVGNPRWMDKDSPDHKGFHGIIGPALEQLRSAGLNIETRFAGQGLGWIGHADMPAYYEGIDVLLCASRSETTPNPVLEAMASGLAVISTDVGIVTEVFGPKQRQFILHERNIEAMKRAIQKLYENPALLVDLSRENLESARQHDWQNRIPLWREFFERAAARARARQDIKRAMIRRTFRQQQRINRLQKPRWRWRP